MLAVSTSAVFLSCPDEARSRQHHPRRNYFQGWLGIRRENPGLARIRTGRTSHESRAHLAMETCAGRERQPRSRASNRCNHLPLAKIISSPLLSLRCSPARPDEVREIRAVCLPAVASGLKLRPACRQTGICCFFFSAPVPAPRAAMIVISLLSSRYYWPRRLLKKRSSDDARCWIPNVSQNLHTCS